MLLSDSYIEAIRWIFDTTNFQYIMTCLIGLESNQQEIYKYIWEKKKIIDRATGDKIAFIYPVEGKLISHSQHPVFLKEKEATPFMSLNEGEKYILPEKISDAIFDECPRLLDFDHNQLPGIVVIGRESDGFPQFYHFDSIREFDLYLGAIVIIDSFVRDYSKYKKELLSYNNREKKENLENQLSILLKEKNDRFKDASVDFKSLIPDIASALIGKEVNEEDVNKVYRRQNLWKLMKELTQRYPQLRDSSDVKCLCKKARVMQQCLSLENKIADIRARMEDAIPQENIDALHKKIGDIKSSWRAKLTKIVLDEQDAEHFLDTSHSANSLFELCRFINDRSRKILNRINSFYETLNTLGYDIFISCKSEDYHAAHSLYDFLLKNGCKPFLADYSLREVGTDRYGELIRQVIDRCSHMIVFATNIDYISTEYVRHEWTLFYDEIMAGRKKGKLFAVIPSLKSITDLPVEFRNTQCFEIDSFDQSIMDFVR